MKIDRARKVKEQRVVICCNEKEEVNKMTQRFRDVAWTLNVKTLENQDHLIVLKDVLTINKDEEILKAVSRQNKQL